MNLSLFFIVNKFLLYLIQLKIGAFFKYLTMKCIVNKTDFKIKVYIKDITQTIVNPLNFDWELFYYTIKDVPFSVSHQINNTEHQLSSNTIVLEDNSIEIRVNGFDFAKKGVLKFKSKLHFINPDFSDGVQTVETPEEELNIQIL